MFVHNERNALSIGSLIENRGSVVLVFRVTDDVKNGLPGFDGIQRDNGYYRGRWGYTEDTERIIAPAGDPAAAAYASEAAAWLVANDPDNWLLDELADVFPEQVAAARTGK